MLEGENNASERVVGLEILVDEAVEIDPEDIDFQGSIPDILLKVFVLPYQRSHIVRDTHEWNSLTVFSSVFYTMGFFDIAATAAIEIFADFNLRWYAQTDLTKYLYSGIGGYVGVVYFLIRSLRDDNLLLVNSVWDGVSSLIESVAAYVLLGDRLKTAQQYLGLVMTILGVVLLKMDGNK
jgi:multidrug transporter EmrE-like cation transporter